MATLATLDGIGLCSGKSGRMGSAASKGCGDDGWIPGSVPFWTVAQKHLFRWLSIVIGNSSRGV